MSAPPVDTTADDAVAALRKEKKPAFSKGEALAEADRCLFCHDAPCMRSCPTHIDVPRFIKRIATGNLAGAADTIFAANVLGHSCARVCPTEVLCEGACVLNDEHRAIDIGRLQRHATDFALRSGQAIVTAGPRRAGAGSVGIIGAGPAGLACAAELLRLGYAATIYEARPEGGGLNTYGVAQYKLTPEAALEEVAWLTRAGLDIRYGVAVGRDVSLAELEGRHAALFIGVGMAGIPPLGLPGEALPGVCDALDLIEDLKFGRTQQVSGARVAVIGGGNTSIDVVTQALRAGAAEVLLLYRRGPEAMPAYAHEVALLRDHGGRVLYHHSPEAILDPAAGRVTGLRARRGDGEVVTIAADVVVRATGQKGAGVLSVLPVQSQSGKVQVDAEGRTSHPRYWAGGDCVSGGKEVVNAVEEGKQAARSMARHIMDVRDGALAAQAQ